jgi:hypothetical protein
MIFGRDNAIQGDLDTVIFTSIVSTILELLRFKCRISSHAQQWFWIGNQEMYFTETVKLY